MLSTGDLSILRDTALRDALIAYDERAQINRVIWQSIREETATYGQPLYNNVKISIDLDGNPISSIESVDAVAIAEDPGFRSMLNVLAGSKGNIHELCAVQLRRVERVKQSLAEQY